MTASISSQSIFSLQSPFRDIVSVWYVDLDAHFETLDLDILTTSEVHRAARMINALDARRFIASRHALRTLLASCIACSPREIRYQKTESGKPSVVDATVEFSLSRSYGFALIAYSRNRPVGADIEVVRPVPERDSLIQSTFGDNEKQAFQSFQAESRDEAFLRTWVRKEACLKATGLDLSLPLSRIAVGAGPGKLDVCIAYRQDQLRLEVDSIESPTSTVAAIAVFLPD
jgi:4'-phosphopantetheinyl transferase